MYGTPFMKKTYNESFESLHQEHLFTDFWPRAHGRIMGPVKNWRPIIGEMCTNHHTPGVCLMHPIQALLQNNAK